MILFYAVALFIYLLFFYLFTERKTRQQNKNKNTNRRSNWYFRSGCILDYAVVLSSKAWKVFRTI